MRCVRVKKDSEVMTVQYRVHVMRMTQSALVMANAILVENVFVQQGLLVLHASQDARVQQSLLQPLAMTMVNVYMIQQQSEQSATVMKGLWVLHADSCAQGGVQHLTSAQHEASV